MGTGKKAVWQRETKSIASISVFIECIIGEWTRHKHVGVASYNTIKARIDNYSVHHGS